MNVTPDVWVTLDDSIGQKITITLLAWEGFVYIVLMGVTHLSFVHFCIGKGYVMLE